MDSVLVGGKVLLQRPSQPQGRNHKVRMLIEHRYLFNLVLLSRSRPYFFSDPRLHELMMYTVQCTCVANKRCKIGSHSIEKLDLHPCNRYLGMQATVCPRSSDPFYIVTYLKTCSYFFVLNLFGSGFLVYFMLDPNPVSNHIQTAPGTI